MKHGHPSPLSCSVSDTRVRCSLVHVVSCVDVGASYIPTKPELHESGTKSGANKAWFQFQSVWEFCKEDTGREIFALKAGLAVLLPHTKSLGPILYGPFSLLSMYSRTRTVGATFNRGFNRALGTLAAGILAIVVAETALSV
ncbi:Aluminum-activated malate transporter 9 [Glycine max]|nr:Aluminum-activated malate transporter 9 [Glycine max]